MNESGKSDKPIVPAKSANNGGPGAGGADGGKGLGQGEFLTAKQVDRTQRRIGVRPEGLPHEPRRTRRIARRWI